MVNLQTGAPELAGSFPVIFNFIWLTIILILSIDVPFIHHGRSRIYHDGGGRPSHHLRLCALNNIINPILRNDFHFRDGFRILFSHHSILSLHHIIFSPVA